MRLAGGPLHTRPGPKRGLVVIGAPANDFHGLPTALVADALRGRGFSVADLGANTPSESFVETVIGASRLIGIGIAASTQIVDAHVAATVAAIKAVTDVPVLLGGLAIRNKTHAHQLVPGSSVLHGKSWHATSRKRRQ